MCNNVYTATECLESVGDLRAWMAQRGVDLSPFVAVDDPSVVCCLCVVDVVGAFAELGWVVIDGVFNSHAAPTDMEAFAVCAANSDEP